MKRLWMLALIALHGCTTRPPAPICHLDMNLALFPPWQPDPHQFDTSLWSGLLLRGTQMDCTGRTLDVPDAAAEPLKSPKIALQQHHGSTWLVWLKTHRTADGRFWGPVARTHVAYEQMQVQAIGTLYAPERGFSMRWLEATSPQMLQIMQGSCEPMQGAPCDTEMQLLTIENGQFESAPGGAIALARRHAVPCGKACLRTTVLEADVTCDPNAPSDFLVHERMVVHELTESTAVGPGRLLRRSEATRTLHYADHRWHSSTTPLWERAQAW
jgi:hypothetical protein